MTSPTPSQGDPLSLALRHTEAELEEKLEEACVPETKDVSGETTAELAKLSDSLLAAARAAKDVIALRQRRHKEAGTAPPAGDDAIREFNDREGRAWRVWAVTPSHLRASKREASLGEYEEGWLAFETLDEELRRRLPRYPADWRTMPDIKLQELLARAVEATRRIEPPRAPEPPGEPSR